MYPIAFVVFPFECCSKSLVWWNSGLSFLKMRFCLPHVTACVNKALKSLIYLGSLKCTNVSPIYKKLIQPITIEHWLYYHLYQRLWNSYASINFYSIKFCVDFKKYDLFWLLASWQKPLDKVGFVGYDYLPYDLLLAGFPFNKI